MLTPTFAPEFRGLFFLYLQPGSDASGYSSTSAQPHIDCAKVTAHPEEHRVAAPSFP